MYKMESTNKKKVLSDGQYILSKLRKFPKLMKEKINNLPEKYQAIILGRKAAYMTIKAAISIPKHLNTNNVITYLDKEYGTSSIVINYSNKNNKYGHKRYGSVAFEIAFYDSDFNTIPMYDTIYFIVPGYPAICNFFNKAWKLDASVIDEDNWVEIDNDNLAKGHYATFHPQFTSFFNYDTFVYADSEQIEIISDTLKKDTNVRFTQLTYIVDLG